ncbi:MAG: hypothetical protein AAGA96_15970 [Verrucomicrobiota bacterium]
MRVWSKFFILKCILGVATLCPTSSKADSLTGDERGTILLELNDIEDVLDGKQLSVRMSAAQTFQAASASQEAAWEFYLKCHKTLNFDSKDASYSEYRNWRERQEDRVKTEANVAAMRMQLQYLVLSMKAAEAAEIDSIIPELEQFVSTMVANSENLSMKTMQESVKKTIFAQAYHLDKSLELESWSFSPGNYGEVYQETVFPHFRATAPQELAAAWDRRIALESGLVSRHQAENADALDRYQKDRLPTLHWQKAMDVFAFVSQKEGSSAMLQLVRNHPDHPNIRNWVENFRKLLYESTTSASDEYSEITPESVDPGPAPVDPDNPLGFE